MPRRNPPQAPSITQAPVSPHLSMASESSETESSFSTSASSKPQPAQPRLGMDPEARYQHNLKVLRRRDPTILSIFDQFSHICLYKLENQKWERTGCEGSMFLFESSTYPPYGYYILNRTGNQDYIARLYPEDWLSGVGSMTAIRHFDAFTEQRLAAVKASLRPGEPMPGPFDQRYLVPNVEKLSENMKTTAEHSMVGLWYHAGASRESLDAVMMRLQSYNRKNERYPDEFRYGSSHPPPRNSLGAATRGSDASSSATTTSASESESENATVFSKSPEPPAPKQQESQAQLATLLAGLSRPPAQPTSPPAVAAVAQTSNLNAIDSLFANAMAKTTLGGPVVPPTPPAAPPMLAALFASAASAPVIQQQPPPPQQYPMHAPVPAPSTGLQTLTSNNGLPLQSQPGFNNGAFQTQILSNGPQSHSLHNGPQAHTVPHNGSPPNGHPQPRLGPQIFDQTVLNTLMGGVVPGRSASAASMRSHATSRDGDNELGSDDDASPTSVVGYPPRDAYGGHGSTRPAGQGFLSVPGLAAANGGGGGVRGDATPRAFQTKDLKGVPAPSVIESVSSIATVRPSSHQQQQQQQHNGNQKQQQQQQAPRANRPLVPFADDSELWPYPNESTGDSSSAEEIVELSFEETNLLSDYDGLYKRQQQMKNGLGHAASTNGAAVNGNGHGVVVNGSGGAKKGKKNRRKESGTTRRERDAAEREEIERSWDVPDYVTGSQVGHVQASSGSSNAMAQAGYAGTFNTAQHGTRQRELLSSPPASPSPPPLPVSSNKKPVPMMMMKKGGPISAATAAAANGKTPSVNGVNGKHTTAGIDKTATRNAIVGAMNAADIYSDKMGRDEFVRGVLELVQNDREFVDSLYQQYLLASN